MAKAIAAVCANKAAKLVDESLHRQEIPGIIFIGTVPTLYRITVSNKLLECLNNAEYPEGHRTTVRKLVRPNHERGMGNLKGRQLVFRHFEAFKNVIKSMDARNGPNGSNTASSSAQ